MDTPSVSKRKNADVDPHLVFCTGIAVRGRDDHCGDHVQRLGLSNTEIALYTSWLYLPGSSNPCGARSWT